jgi:hypothetical protein
MEQNPETPKKKNKFFFQGETLFSQEWNFFYIEKKFFYQAKKIP